MDTDKLLKKLKEIKVDAYNNVHSSEEESPLQVYDGVWGRLPVDEDAKGEDVKIERTKGEKVKVPKTLSRTTSMSGAESPSKDIYLTDGGTKKSIQQKLDEFKEFLEVRKTKDYYSSGRTPQESSILAAMQVIENHIEELEAMDSETKSMDWWFEEMEHAKVELQQLEDMLANIHNPDWKPFKKNDPMATAKLVLAEGPRNDKEAEVFLMLEDAVDKANHEQVQQILMMLPQGM